MTRLCNTPRVRLITAFCAFVGALSCFASEPRSIRYIYPDQVVFTAERDADGRVKNPLVKVAMALFEHAGYDLRVLQYPAARMFKHLEEGDADFAFLVKAPGFDECCLFSKKPFTSTELRVYHKQSKRPIKTEQDLIGQSLITLRGYSYGPLKPFLNHAENRLTLSPTATHESAFAMLERGRADYVLNYKHPSIEVLLKQPIEDVVFSPLREIKLYMVLNKRYPNAKQVMAELERAMSELDVDAIMDLPKDSAQIKP